MRLKGKFQLRFSIRLLQNEEAVRPERKYGGKPDKANCWPDIGFYSMQFKTNKVPLLRRLHDAMVKL